MIVKFSKKGVDETPFFVHLHFMETIQLVNEGSHIYNASDHPDHMRGTTIKNGKKVKNSCQLIYSVHAVYDGIAQCQSWDITGKRYEEKIPVKNLIPYKKYKQS